MQLSTTLLAKPTLVCCMIFPLLYSLGLGIVTSNSTPADEKNGFFCSTEGIAHVHLSPPSTTYWKRGREKASIYAPSGPGSVRALARRYAQGALTMLDVGAYDPTFQFKFTWIPSKDPIKRR